MKAKQYFTKLKQYKTSNMKLVNGTAIMKLLRKIDGIEKEYFKIKS